MNDQNDLYSGVELRYSSIDGRPRLLVLQDLAASAALGYHRVRLMSDGRISDFDAVERAKSFLGAHTPLPDVQR